ncbi:MAG: hypothetical protein JO108_32330 [Acidobacteriaceae bacterium]|nr:hypothetical protein [Acidobacteriaceae bacterium]
MLELVARTFSPELPIHDVFKRFGEAHPLGRVGTPEEVAELRLSSCRTKQAFALEPTASVVPGCWPALP